MLTLTNNHINNKQKLINIWTKKIYNLMRKFKAVRVSRKQHSLQRIETVSSGEIVYMFTDRITFTFRYRGMLYFNVSMFQSFNTYNLQTITSVLLLHIFIYN